MSKKIAEQRQDIPENWSGRRIFEAAKQGDTECIRVIDEMAEILGKGIANICYVLNPQIVVLGGGVMEQREMMEPLIKDKLEKYLRPIVRNTTRIAFAEHGNDAGMLGAFYHFRKDHHE
jgi:predicted NBD/HSP70 family sugar kinase